ncbi:hypothetical protein DSO57_1022606 [Entomophthora muscae]|uniref:Uncharacterized protein n=1 Tax=Entomophthora muscae TaxID=34485 RepID=A0ACC2RHR4_9FUNG|nr:hypothetical protein DSO57_1022606 [Entomophthora muscae]
MQYTAPIIPSTIPKDPNKDKPEEPIVTARETTKPTKEPVEPAKNTVKKLSQRKDLLNFLL